jgi:hypothetical protein
MSGAREKGKIARSEWSKIVARYQAGDSIAQLGRDYGCTAPAIRYIIKRTGAFRAAEEGERADLAPSQKTRGPASEERAGGLPARASHTMRAADERVLGAELRERVSADIASFLVALDQVVEGSTQSAAELQDATDRLMRSTARVRLELERLLAREQTVKPTRAIKAHAVAAARGA